MKHRDLVKDGVICYLGVQVAAAGMQLVRPRCEPPIVGIGRISTPVVDVGTDSIEMP